MFFMMFYAGPPCRIMKFLVSCLGVERSRRQKDAGSCCLTRGACQGLLCQAGSTNASTKFFCTGRWGCRPAALALWQIVGAFGELEQAGQYILSMLHIRMTRNNKMSRASPGLGWKVAGWASVPRSPNELSAQGQKIWEISEIMWDPIGQAWSAR